MYISIYLSIKLTIYPDLLAKDSLPCGGLMKIPGTGQINIDDGSAPLTTHLTSLTFLMDIYGSELVIHSVYFRVFPEKDAYSIKVEIYYHCVVL